MANEQKQPQAEKPINYANASRDRLWREYKRLLKEKNNLLKATAVETTETVAKNARVEEAVNIASGLNVEATQQLLENILNAKAQYDGICEAIEAKKLELKNVYDITAEANTLVALAATKDELIRQKNEEAERLIVDAEATAEEKLEDARQEVQTMLDKVTQEVAEGKQAREREEESYVYGFTRRKQLEEDQLQDELDKKRRSLDAREEDLTEREAKHEEMSARIDTLNNEIAALKDSTQAKIDEAVQAARDSEKKSAAIAANYEKRVFESDRKILEGKIETLNGTITRQEAQIERLENAVTVANNKAAEIARSALDNEHAKSAMNSLQKAVETQGNSGKR